MDVTSQQLLQGAAGAASGGAKYVDEVFDIRYYMGNGSTPRKLTNNIDLEGEGGTVWIKAADADNQNWVVVDTERGATKALAFNTGTGQSEESQKVTAFHSDGFSVGSDSSTNLNNVAFQAVTFRRAPKFFDVVTWTGNGTSGHQIPHKLEVVPKMVIVRRYDGAEDWTVYNGNMVDPNVSMIQLNSDGIRNSGGNANYWGEEPNSGADDFSFTSTHFSVGTHGRTNSSGWNYVAYLFATDAGGFGEAGDQSIIKCGHYAGNDGNHLINCGWEAQLSIIKTYTANSTNWRFNTSLMGYSQPTSSSDWATDNNSLVMNNTSSGAQNANTRLQPDVLGFRWNGEARQDANANAQAYFYLAVRSPTGPVANPYDKLSGADRGKHFFTVKAGADTGTPPGSFLTSDTNITPWPVNFAFYRNPTTTDDNWAHIRPTMKRTWLTNGTTTNTEHGSFDVFRSSSGWKNSQPSSQYAWMWKQGPGFTSGHFYGNGTSGHQIPHNLGVVPEMIWIKSLYTADWYGVGHAYANSTNPWNWRGQLNSTTNFDQHSGTFNNTAPTATHFTVGNNQAVNENGRGIVYQLFASVEGLSKCGNYTGDGSATARLITTGFSPRLVIIKRVDNTGNWLLMDTVRGITNYLRISTQGAQSSQTFISIASTGFNIVSTDSDVNNSGENYIYYAHA